MRHFVQAAYDAFLEAGEEPQSLELVVKSFSEETLPILHTLAKEFVVCDHWFSSVPSASHSNRLFMHAASSGGMASQPTWAAYEEAVDGLQFENGTIFDRLDNNCLDWKVYSTFLTSFVKLVVPSPLSQGTLDPGDQFKSLEDLKEALESADEDFPSYVHIEPNHWKESAEEAAVPLGNSDTYQDIPSSQHPDGRRVEAGERLIKYVYESLRASPIWEKSVLIIMYDECGGFFDHVVPPEAVPPGDNPFWIEGNQEEIAKDFKFDRLGMRVPALVISPLVDKGIVDDTVYDHSSVVKTLTERFGLGHLTERDKAANSIWHLIKDAPRQDCPMTLPPTVRSEG
jgi:phospholipase C